jgi:signal transduction histidine kinase
MILPTDPAVYLTPLALLTLIASFVQIRKSESSLVRRKKEVDQKIYETLILREIGERIGYELNLERILDTIVGSLNRLLPYSVVGYILTTGDQTKADLRFHLEETVNRSFLNSIRTHMLDDLTKVIGRGIPVENITENITGTIIDEGQKDQVSSLWLVPLSISNQSFGVLAISSKHPGLYKGEEMEVLNKILAQANRAVTNLNKVISTEEEKLNSMVSSMADGVLMLDANLGLLVINPATIRLLDLSENKKPTILDIAAKLSDKVDLRTKIDESIQDNKVVVFDNLTVGGKVSTLLISPVKDSGGKFLGTVVLFHDISAQKELEKIRDEFTAMMVHELRAPLTVVRGATDMFLRDPNVSAQPQGQELLKTMQSSAGTMLALVNDLLDAAKIGAGKFQILKTSGNLTEIINDRILFFNQMAAPKSIVIAADGIEPAIMVEFDRDRISQVFGNLLSNAIKFTPIGGKIVVSAYRVNTFEEIKWRFSEGKPDVSKLKVPSILVSISDTGMGISSEQLPLLFSKFRQLHSSGQNGTGLGLVIAKGIIESHEGSILVQSKSNEGTTFYFTIPTV